MHIILGLDEKEPKPYTVYMVTDGFKTIISAIEWPMTWLQPETLVDTKELLSACRLILEVVLIEKY